MGDLGEGLRGRRADPQARAVGARQIGEPGFDFVIASPQPVVFGVADIGRVVVMIEPVVAGNLGRQPLELGLRLRRAQCRGREVRHILRHGQPAPARIRLSAAARAASVTRAPASMRATSSRRASADSDSTRVTARPPASTLATRK